MSADQSWGPQGMPLAMALAAVAGFSLTPILTNELLKTGMPPEIISFWRFAVMGVLLLPFLNFRQFRATLAGMVVGGALAYTWIAYAMTLQKMPILIAATFYLSYPLFLMFMVWGLLNVVPGARSALSGLFVFAALAVLLQKTMVATLDWASMGLVLVAPIGFAFALTIQRGWLGQLGPMHRLASIAVGGGLALIPVAIRHPVDVIVPRGDAALLVFALAIFATAIPQVLQTLSAHRIGPLRSAVAVGFEIPLITMLALFLYTQRASVFELAAAFLVIGALVINALSRQPHGRPPMA